jgi:hypothetical protein
VYAPASQRRATFAPPELDRTPSLATRHPPADRRVWSDNGWHLCNGCKQINSASISNLRRLLLTLSSCANASTRPGSDLDSSVPLRLDRAARKRGPLANGTLSSRRREAASSRVSLEVVETGLSAVVVQATVLEHQPAKKTTVSKAIQQQDDGKAVTDLNWYASMSGRRK